MSAFDDKRIRWYLAAVVGLGLLLRIAHLWFLSHTAFPRIPLYATQSDMFAFWNWAQRIVSGDWLGRDTYHPYFHWMMRVAPLETWYTWWGGKEIYHQAPVYPYLLAVILSLKNSPTFAMAAQLLLGGLQPLVMFFLARRLFNDSRIALVSAAMTAFYGPFIFYQGVILRDWLPPILEPLIILLVLLAKERRTARDSIGAGLVMGLAVLTKETALVVCGVASIWLLLQYRHSWRDALRPFSLIALGFLLCLSPLIARNVAVGAPPLAVSVQGAGNVMLGFAPDMTPIGFEIPGQDAVDIVLRGHGKFVNTMGELLKAYGNSGYAKLVGHELLKVRGLLDPFEIPNNTSYYYGLEISPALSATIGYAVVLPLAVIGFLLLLGQWRKQTLLYSYLAASLAVQMVTFTIARFRLSLVPVLILGASFAVVYIIALVKDRRLKRLLACAAAVGFVALAQHFLIPLPHKQVRASDRVSAAIVHLEEGRFAKALAQIAIVHKQMGRDFPTRVHFIEAQTHLKWSQQLLESGDRQGALQHLDLAEQIYAKIPDVNKYPYPLYNLGLGYARLGQTNKAAKYFRLFLNLGIPGPPAEMARRFLATMPQ